ncbi:hypothetical protein T310_8700, partial [Rasamsonia emersonii CBS 393.64]
FGVNDDSDASLVGQVDSGLSSGGNYNAMLLTTLSLVVRERDVDTVKAVLREYLLPLLFGDAGAPFPIVLASCVSVSVAQLPRSEFLILPIHQPGSVPNMNPCLKIWGLVISRRTSFPPLRRDTV